MRPPAVPTSRFLAFALALVVATSPLAGQQRPRARELGVRLGVLAPGRWNAITDVDGVRVGHRTIVEGLEEHEPKARTRTVEEVNNDSVGPSSSHRSKRSKRRSSTR